MIAWSQTTPLIWAVGRESAATVCGTEASGGAVSATAGSALTKEESVIAQTVTNVSRNLLQRIAMGVAPRIGIHDNVFEWGRRIDRKGSRAPARL
jgi:hypothetical protein